MTFFPVAGTPGPHPIYSAAILLLSCLTLAAPPAAAAEPSLTLGAFGSLTAGRLFDGSVKGTFGPNPAIECPCAVVDWANRSVYEDTDWQFEPDSKAGLQLIYQPTPTLGFTTQVISRGQDLDPDLEWAYLSWNFLPDWQTDIGRKRIPLYFYSDFQDVGTAYPWVSPPGEVYGWESTNYNGASLRYSTNWQDLDVRGSVFGGQEHIRNNPYLEVFYDQPTNSRWDDIRGADLELSRDWWTTRAVYLRTNTLFDDHIEPWREDLEAYGLAFNVDYERWLFLSEAGAVLRDNKDGTSLDSTFYSVGAGYRLLEHWSAFANYADYYEKSTDPDYEYVRYNTASLTLQYELSKRQNVKLQYDHHLDDSINFMGDVNLVRLSWNLSYWSPNLLR